MYKKIRNIIMVPIICMIVGYLLLVLVNLIPGDWIRNEAKESAEILSQQGTYVDGIIDGWFLDNWTDADCISITINKSSSNPFYNAINAFQLGGEGEYPGSIEALQSTVDGRGKYVGDHSFLWNGFQIWLRILMVKYNISEIRMFVYLLTILLIAVVCILLSRVKNNICAFIPFLAAISFFNFQMDSLSLLFFNDICIMLIASIGVIWIYANGKRKYAEEFFAGIGALVAFSSMLIMPLITLGFPLIIYLILANEENSKDNLLTTVKCTVSWVIGYAMTMITKVLLSILIINSETGIDRVSSHTGQGEFSILERLSKIVEVFMRVVNRSEMERDLAIFISILLVSYVLIRKRSNFKRFGTLWPILIVALFPCVWCFVCASHAGHGWTQWNFAISIFAILQMFWEVCEFKCDMFEITKKK